MFSHLNRNRPGKYALLSQSSAYFFLGALAVFALLPMVYIVTNSFIGPEEFARYYGSLHRGRPGRSPFHLIPEWITLSGYHEVFIARPHVLVRFWNSLFLSLAILAGQSVIAVLGGYAFARFRFPGRDEIFLAVILLMMMPYQVTLVPNFIVLDHMGLIGSYWALILPGVFSAFGVVLMRQTMLGLPVSAFEAAQLDGAGPWRILLYVALPGCKPGLAALVVINFADSWGMIEQPLIFLNDALRYPMSVFLTQINASQPEIGFVSSVLAAAPALLIFLRFKDEMMMGVEYGVIP